MNNELITITEYCVKYEIDPLFINSLEESGIIVLTNVGLEKFIHTAQFTEIDRYIHFHYDLHINIEGIDAIRHLLNKVSSLQDEISQLKRQLQLHET